MYEEYTDKQIVEMLLPKLDKAVPQVNWYTKLFYNNELVKAIATCYRSGYVRGQLHRSFIIGEKKQKDKSGQIEKWVPANEENISVSDKVRMIDKSSHKYSRYCYPKAGTIGTALKKDKNSVFVQWPEGTTSINDQWWANYEKLEVLVCE